MGAVAKKMLFQPPSIKYAPNMNFFDLLSREEGGKSHTIKAFFIRAASQDGFCILFSHGNAEDLSMIYPWFKDVAIKLGVNVCCYDYTGYGLSKDAHDGPSGPGEQHCFNDALTVYNHLVSEGIPEEKIILYGRSLDSGPTYHLAKMLEEREGAQRVAGVILQSPLLSAYRVAFHFRYSMPGDMMCNIDKIPYIRSPVFIIHGRQDEIVPFWHGEELYLATHPRFRYQPLWVNEAGHNNIEVTLRKKGGNNLFFDHMQDFIEYITVNPATETFLSLESERNCI